MKTSSPEKKLPLVVILGPTAVGKTGIALELAERNKAEIISADSRLFYTGMDIGTAKPSLEERRRVPHHLVDIAMPDEVLSLAHFQELASQAIRDICARQKLPFLVGGTGQYIRSVIEGWRAPGVTPEPALRLALEQWAESLGPSGLHERLAILDPSAASEIDPRNLRRTVRALEVILTSGQLFSEQRRKGESAYDLLLVGLIRPRQELYARIDARIAAMFEADLVEEVKRLLGQAYAPELPSLSAIGYRQVIQFLAGEIDLEEAKLLIRRATRTYVRRQANWFKIDDPTINWFQVTGHVIDEIDQTIRTWISSR